MNSKYVLVFFIIDLHLSRFTMEKSNCRSRTVSCSEEGGVGGRQQQQDGETGQPPPLAARSWLYSFLKPKE